MLRRARRIAIAEKPKDVGGRSSTDSNREAPEVMLLGGPRRGRRFLAITMAVLD
jgi:hypothetical protein